MDCESSVEIWLQAVISAIKSSLQARLASALGMPIPEGIKISNGITHESSPQGKRETTARASASPQQRKVVFAPETETIQSPEDMARSELDLPSSWSLRNTNEIVILVMQIELRQKFEKCFSEIQSGDKNSLERMYEYLSAILHSASGLLQGASTIDHLQEVIELEPSSGRRDSVEEEEVVDAADLPKSTQTSSNDVRIVLSPSQIQKLTNLIFMLSAKRDLAARLSKLAITTDQNDNDDGKGDMSKTFEWQSQLKYSWSQSTATCNISMMDYNCEYGFEYQGSAARMISTPETDRALFWMTQGMSNYAPCLIIGSTVSMVFFPIQSLCKMIRIAH